MRSSIIKRNLMGPELDEITWSGEVLGFFIYFLNKEAQRGEKGARNLWRMFRC